MQKQAILKNLRLALKSAKMDDAGFDNMGGSTLQQRSRDGSIVLRDPVNETEYIKDRTKLYRESWIIPCIEEAIELLTKGK